MMLHNITKCICKIIANLKIGSQLIMLWSFVSCNGLLDVGPPATELVSTAVFDNDAMADGAMAGIYHNMISSQSVFSGGGSGSVSFLGSLASDDLVFDGTNVVMSQFSENNVRPDNAAILTIWSSAYKRIYEANSIIEGVSSGRISEQLERQLKGEALFIRAFCHFYLTNAFGEIPIITSTNYHENRLKGKAGIAEVYIQVEKDLEEAIELLPIGYNHANGERVRANRAAASALLARTFLYQKKWQLAIDFSNSVINQNETYFLSDDPNDVFLKNNHEAIWQLLSVDAQVVTYEAFNALNHSTSNPPSATIGERLLLAFEEGDIRAQYWIGELEGQDGTRYVYPLKYKTSRVVENNRPEYSVVLRLAEQYLVRAEAFCQLGLMAEALDNINSLRIKRGISPLKNIGDQGEVMDVIIQERRREFFCEWGHRWFDLKRWGKSGLALSELPHKDWQDFDIHWPIPETEIRKNDRLRPQNNGY